jgi:hypothetical protein
LVAGAIVSITLGRFPPFGIIIAGFLVGFISMKPKEGAIMAGALAILAAVVQLAVLNNLIPFFSLGASALLSGFDGLSDLFVNAFTPSLGVQTANSVTVYVLYFLFGALGGFTGGLLRHS